jgi:ribosomal protein S27AE
MAEKHLGTCPFCKELVTPYVVEGNVIRRDKCQCPNCHKIVYVCRTPGCCDYARGGELYDDELCPSCSASVVTNGSTVAVAVLITAITNAISKNGGGGGGDGGDSFF